VAEKVKLTVNLTQDDLNTLREQAASEGITVTDALRRSIAVGRIAARAKAQGQKLLVQGEDGELRQIEIL
jgi:hypothetical protein